MRQISNFRLYSVVGEVLKGGTAHILTMKDKRVQGAGSWQVRIQDLNNWLVREKGLKMNYHGN